MTWDRALWWAITSVALAVSSCALGPRAELHPVLIPVQLDSSGVRIQLETPYVVTKHPTTVCVRVGEGIDVRNTRRGGTVQPITFSGEIETEDGRRLPLVHSSYYGRDRVCLGEGQLRPEMGVVGLRLFSSEPLTVYEVSWRLITG